MPKVEQVGRAAEGAVMTEGCGMWPVQTGLRMTPPLLKELLNIGEKREVDEKQRVQKVEGNWDGKRKFFGSRKSEFKYIK